MNRTANKNKIDIINHLQEHKMNVMSTIAALRSSHESLKQIFSGLWYFHLPFFGSQNLELGKTSHPSYNLLFLTDSIQNDWKCIQLTYKKKCLSQIIFSCMLLIQWFSSTRIIFSFVTGLLLSTFLFLLRAARTSWFKGSLVAWVKHWDIGPFKGRCLITWYQ